jgi:hypothetical protein
MLPANIRLGWKWLLATSTLAYTCSVLITRIKCLKVQSPWLKMHLSAINNYHFMLQTRKDYMTSTSWLQAEKLECFILANQYHTVLWNSTTLYHKKLSLESVALKRKARVFHTCKSISHSLLKRHIFMSYKIKLRECSFEKKS